MSHIKATGLTNTLKGGKAMNGTHKPTEKYQYNGTQVTVTGTLNTKRLAEAIIAQGASKTVQEDAVPA